MKLFCHQGLGHAQELLTVQAGSRAKGSDLSSRQLRKSGRNQCSMEV